MRNVMQLFWSNESRWKPRMKSCFRGWIFKRITFARKRSFWLTARERSCAPLSGPATVTDRDNKQGQTDAMQLIKKSYAFAVGRGSLSAKILLSACATSRCEAFVTECKWTISAFTQLVQAVSCDVTICWPRCFSYQLSEAVCYWTGMLVSFH